MAPRRPAVAAAPVAPAVATTDDAEPDEPPPTSGVPASAPLVVEAPAAVEPAPPPPPPAAVEPPPALTPSRLAAEVALVDRARDALQIGDHPAALAALAAYHQQFPRGDLDAEADLVMIETLIAQRDYPRARELAAAFLAHFPRSPLGQRVHSLIDRIPSRLPSQ